MLVIKQRINVLCSRFVEEIGVEKKEPNTKKTVSEYMVHELVWLL